MEKNENDLVKTSVSILTAALIQDKGFRLSWQASIAQSIIEVDQHGRGKEFEHCAHAAANNFLSKLCQTKFEVL